MQRCRTSCSTPTFGTFCCARETRSVIELNGLTNLLPNVWLPPFFSRFPALSGPHARWGDFECISEVNHAIVRCSDCRRHHQRMRW